MRPLSGETESGDIAVLESSADLTLAAVIDGSGHGPKAAAAARVAAKILEAGVGEEVGVLVERCHQALEQTRGASISLAAIDAGDNTMTWVAIGNVKGTLVERQWPTRSIFPAAGVAGVELPRLRPDTLDLRRGSTLILATDGVRSGFSDSLAASGSPQQVADRILGEHGKETDDALVLVVRYLKAAQ
jgi:hypothetical protein